MAGCPPCLEVSLIEETERGLVLENLACGAKECEFPYSTHAMRIPRVLEKVGWREQFVDY